jgi:HSP20 family molecular chaperone IbpA
MNTTLTPRETTDAASCSSDASCQTIRPRADIYEVDDAWFVTLDMPGVDESGTDVSIEKGVLTVTGKVDAFDTEGWKRHLGQLEARSFERSFRLPDEIDTSAIEAHVKNGVLRLRLPKAAEAMPHKITVKAG